MKKVLLGAGLIALATSCTQDEFSSLATQKEDVRGISFEMVETPQSRIQWDETETSYSPYWHAEVDRVGIYSAGANRVYNAGTWTNPWGANNKVLWTKLANKVTYKATQSAKSGKFTSVDDNNMLGFAKDTVANFFAVYPSSITATVPTETDGKPKHIKLASLPDLNVQTQTGLKGQNPAIVGYAAATSSREESYSSVGETVGLSYKFPLGTLVMKTANANTYTTGTTPMFGKLLDITIEAKGYKVNDDADYTDQGEIKPSRISYPTADAQIQVDTVAWNSKIVLDAATANDSAKIILNINQAWNDDALAMAAILPVKRTGVYSADKKETFTVTFNFEKISLTSPTDKVYNDFTANFMEFPALDIESFNYLVTNQIGTNDRTLIVNKGTFAAIFDKNDKVIWPAAADGVVNPSEFESIIVNNIALTADEAKKLALFTSAKNISLEETTALPKGTFVATQAVNILSIDMPKVTSIDKEFSAAAFAKLETLKLASYEFENPTVNAIFFNGTFTAPSTATGTMNTLKTLDMSGVTNMLPTFGIDRSLTFENYIKLESVTVQDGMKVSPKGFKGCTGLKAVNGIVDMINGDEAFMNAGSAVNPANARAAAFRTIKVKSTIIPLGAFDGADDLANVLYNNAQVAPTKVGERAFKGTAVQYMDLANLTSVGAHAFDGSALTAPSSTNAIMKIGATTIGEYAFQDTKMTMVNFTAATTIAKGMLMQSTATLKHVKFTKAFTVPAKANCPTSWDSPFGVAANIDLFVNPDQEYLNGTVLTLTVNNTPATETFNFKTVQREE